MRGRPCVDVRVVVRTRISVARPVGRSQADGCHARADGVAPSVGCLEGWSAMMGWYGHDMGAWAWTFMGLFWLIIIGLVVLCIVTLVTTLTHRGRHSEEADSRREGSGNSRDSGAETATDILDRRFARGEIDEETFLAHRAALTSPRRHVDGP